MLGHSFPTRRSSDLSLAGWRSLFEACRERAHEVQPGLADELASDIVLNVNRTSLVNFQNSLLAYQHQPVGVDCVFSGAPTGDANALAWLGRVSTQGPGLPGLPGATLATQQIQVSATAAGFNRVQITICWRGPTDTAMRHHTVVTYVNGLV